MKTVMSRNTFLSVAAIGLFFAGWAVGKEDFQTQKSMIHCAAWTAKDGLTQAEFNTFKAGLAKLPDMFPGLQRIWAGKLGSDVEFNGEKRTHAIALEFDSLKSKRAYSESKRRPEWQALFSTVRKPGSSSFDLVGE
ncbi:MAG: hypothetical protein EXQ56_11815 [Acidobacteria bacterium]|nr:hypothetical protein [Acidobacteriota bacterium]